MAISHDISGGHAAEVAHIEPAAAPVHEAVPATASAPTKTKRKPSLTWRSAHLWLPLVAGFGWQAYLDFGKAMIEKAAY